MKSDAIVGALKEAAKLDVDVDEALDQLTELVEAAHAPTWKNVDAVLSEVPLGFADKTVVVGWDTCGACGRGLKRCECKGGPTEPKYVKYFRSGLPMDSNSPDGLHHMTGPSVRTPTPVSKVDGEDALSPGEGSSQEGVPVSAEDVPSGQDVIPDVRCRDCSQQVLITEADQNDDGTYSCFPCQSGDPA